MMPGLNLRASGAHAPEFTFSVVYHFGSLLGVSHDTACCYHYKGSDLSGLFAVSVDLFVREDGPETPCNRTS